MGYKIVSFLFNIGASTVLRLETIFKYTTRTKCLVYEDLWKKGFYITPGHKFGADFLVYLGMKDFTLLHIFQSYFII